MPHFLTFIIFNIHSSNTSIHSFILHHLTRSVFLYLHRCSSKRRTSMGFRAQNRTRACLNSKPTHYQLSYDSYWTVGPVSLAPEPVLRIHDIFGWIRIRGSMSLDPDPGSGSCYFRHWPSIQDASKKLIFNTIFSAYYCLKLHFQR